MPLLQIGGLVWTLVVVLAVPAVLGVALVVAYSTVETVDEGEIRALLVRGEFRAILEPGINFVPPFVSTVHPVDVGTMTVETETGSIQLPPGARESVRELAAADDGPGTD